MNFSRSTLNNVDRILLDDFPPITKFNTKNIKINIPRNEVHPIPPFVYSSK